MKKTLLFLIFASFFANGQEKRDTIVIKFNSIKKITEKVDSNSKLKPNIFERYYDRENKPLNGLYKVILDSENYYITPFEEGIENNKIFNFKKIYSKGKLIRIDLKGYQIMGSTYLSIFDYNCEKKQLKGALLDVSSDKKLEDVSIKQKKVDNKIKFEIYSNKKKKSSLMLEKDILCSK